MLCDGCDEPVDLDGDDLVTVWEEIPGRNGARVWAERTFHDYCIDALRKAEQDKDIIEDEWGELELVRRTK